MRHAAAKALFFLVAAPAVVRAAWRLHRRRGLRFDRLAEGMRDAAPFRLAFLRRPEYLEATVRRLEPILPPRGFGPCLKRSLLLLDLWSRCGLRPTLHLGTLPAEMEASAGNASHEPSSPSERLADPRGREFHAWVTTPDQGPRTSDAGHDRIWSG